MHADYKTIADENVLRFGTAIDEYGPQLLADRYSDRTHFIYELLQNAEDAIGWRLSRGEAFERTVSFRLTPVALFFQHSGLQFSEEHVRGICNIGKGTKQQDLTAIGKHGIGFKSVYAYTHHPEVHSGQEHFVIESFVRPRIINPRQSPTDETLFVLPFDHPVITPESAYSEILARLQSLNLHTMLFLRHITSIRWESDGGLKGEYLRSVRQLGNDMDHVTLTGNEGDNAYSEQNWILFRKEVLNQGHFAGYIEIAFKLGKIKTGNEFSEVITRVGDSPLVVFFPTEKETQLGFLIQGPYRTTPSRDNIPKDDTWNQYLIQLTASLLTELVDKIRLAGFLTINALEALIFDPEKFKETSQAAMFRPITDAIRNALQNKPIIPRYEGGYVAGNDSKLADNENVRKLISPGQLTKLLNSGRNLFWVTADLPRNKSNELRQFLQKVILIEEIDNETAIRKMDNDFLESEPDEWMANLYEFFQDHQVICKQPWFIKKPIIRLSDNSHVPPQGEDGSSTAYLPTDEQTDFPTVKASVIKTDKAWCFLESLGLKSPDLVDDVIFNVLPRYQDESNNYPAEFDFDVTRIIESFQTDSIKKRKELVTQLKKANWIPCKRSGSGYLVLTTADENTYLPTAELLGLFTGNKKIWFVDQGKDCLKEKKATELLEECGAARFLNRIPCDCDLQESYFEKLRRDNGLYRETSSKVLDYKIEGFQRTIDQINEKTQGWKNLSYHLWICLKAAIANYREDFLFGVYEWTYSRETKKAKFPASFIRLLKNSKWLPGNNNDLRKPSEICFKDLPQEYQRNFNQHLVDVLDFKPDEVLLLAEKTGIDPDILNYIRDNKISAEQFRARFGIPNPGDSSGIDESPESSSTGLQKHPKYLTVNSQNLEENSQQTLDSVEVSPYENKTKNDSDSAVNISADGIDVPDEGKHQGSSLGAPNRQSGWVNDKTNGNNKSSNPGKQNTQGLPSDVDSRKEARGHTSNDREAIINRMARDLEQATSLGLVPWENEAFTSLQPPHTFQSDEKYRDAVLIYEQTRGRIPVPKDERQEGHDVDSFIREKGSFGRKLTRRIEIKGKGVQWLSDEIVELSARQFNDAASCRVEDNLHKATDFDYWLYVVEEDFSGNMSVLPIRNPARRSAHFELRGGTWRHLVEHEPEIHSNPETSS